MKSEIEAAKETFLSTRIEAMQLFKKLSVEPDNTLLSRNYRDSWYAHTKANLELFLLEAAE